ncbi:hypothetical protein MCOR07_002994 [Pyricularia oryzae]|uniref:Uncharacterized protein n=1 Tax=Pyricularia grisea TaxID=148305 RepID=A0ABQ8N9M2_PYRGI|nr:hypothetical protein MCOR01_000565 [Pyricularia oryzae]KAI6293558.1 hypothetical protein MCOR33_009061 [Pyricularia grisea]KAI6310805.1 hypothetical protein MCOR30_011012 [Pyricularia oryzae]KAI6340464.1 hypothetical protein MCOR28_006562 [Pyricularia oryzae]KAI6360657.1 hypothetical protein MCOR32_008906 [Pyricularia oryzae]
MYLLDYAMPIIPRSIPIIASRKGMIPMETIQHRCALVYLGVFSGVLKPIPLTSAVAAPLISPPKQSGIGP